MMSTASGAGHTLRIEWTTLRLNCVRIEELVKHQRSLLGRGLAGRSDEDAAARRRFKYLIGPSAIGSTLQRKSSDSRICWREAISE